MDYVTQVNATLRVELAKFESSVVYGQNINAGSRLGGLAKGLGDISGCTVINTPNVENSLVGMGFGLMLSGTPSVYVMKQQDFVLLGVDQLVNTWNALRSRGPFVPFVIAMIVVDSGWEGPQSSFNNTDGLASLVRIPSYFPTGAAEIPLAVAGAFQGGPAILSVSQRLFKQEPIETQSDGTITSTDSYVVYKHEATLATAPVLVLLCTNFSIDNTWLVREQAKERGYSVTVVSYFSVVDGADEQLLGICSGADSVVVFDDSKSELGAGASLVMELQTRLPSTRIESVVRQDPMEWHLPREDFLSIDVQSIFANQIKENHGTGPVGRNPKR
jgi:pyruvate/2-oxoglutarate/acetoin dehydrogenase E1 component